MCESIFQMIVLNVTSCIVALKTFYLVLEVSILKIKNKTS